MIVMMMIIIIIIIMIIIVMILMIIKVVITTSIILLLIIILIMMIIIIKIILIILIIMTTKIMIMIVKVMINIVFVSFLRCSTRHAVGDTEATYPIQSCIKPLMYALAIKENGADAVHQYVGQEPSMPKTFNEINLSSSSKATCCYLI